MIYDIETIRKKAVPIAKFMRKCQRDVNKIVIQNFAGGNKF